MSPAVAGAALPSRSDIEGWDTSYLDDADLRWRAGAEASESGFEQHLRNVSAPGGTMWRGEAADAALDRAFLDLTVVRRHGEVQTEAAGIARRGSEDIQAARSRVLDAIADAEDDGFRVGEDATDALVGQQLQAKAAELEGIRFEGESSSNQGDPTIRLVDNKTERDGVSGRSESDSQVKESAGTWQDLLMPPEAGEATGSAESPLEALLGEDKVTAAGEQPANLDEAVSEVAGQPIAVPPTAAERILNQHAGTGKGGDRRYTQHPLEAPLVAADPSVVDQQRARVDAAHENVASAQAALDAGLAQSTMAGPGAGLSRDQLESLGQALFDARHEVSSQTEILENLGAAAGEVGQGNVPIPALPENAHVQAFQPEPSAFAEGSRALSEGSLGFIPDVAKHAQTFTNWGEASPEDRLDAVLDTAGMAPLPGGKFLTEGLERALDGFNATRHIDDALDAASTGTHRVPDAPTAPHVDLEANQGVGTSFDPTPFYDDFIPVERDIANAAQDVYSSAAMNDIRQAAQNGVPAEIEINGYKVLYEPDIPGSGFSLASFGERGFAIGPEAMASEMELARTVAHELYRVNMSEIPELGVDAMRAASETDAAFDFAQRFGDAMRDIGG